VTREKARLDTKHLEKERWEVGKERRDGNEMRHTISNKAFKVKQSETDFWLFLSNGTHPFLSLTFCIFSPASLFFLVLY
jgi:hypothetical protein